MLGAEHLDELQKVGELRFRKVRRRSAKVDGARSIEAWNVPHLAVQAVEKDQLPIVWAKPIAMPQNLRCNISQAGPELGVLNR